MPSTLVCVGVGLVLLLVPPSWSFSQGANDASCQEMVPGHIRAQRQYLRHSHISLRTSASSYRPGQLITVKWLSVSPSCAASSVTVRSSRDFMGFLVQARSACGAWDGSRAGAGLRPTRMGPVLVGGSWALTPPGTHTLRCLSDGDTLTHSDKQLKRNLSFVWRAPDAPTGDIRFYVTVVQSYFVYWAGIESAVVRDGSRRNTTSLNPTTQEAFRVRGPSKNMSAASATRTDINSSAAPAPFGIQTLTNTVVSNGDYPHSVTKGNKADHRLALHPHVTGEAGEQTGSPDTHSQDPKSLLLPNIMMQNSSTPHPLLRSVEPKEHHTTAAVPSTTEHVPSTRPHRDTSHNAGDLHQTRSQSGSQPWTSVTKPQTGTTKPEPLLQPHSPPPRLLFKAPSPSSRPFLITTDAFPASQTSTPTVFSQPQTSSRSAEPSSQPPPPLSFLTPHSLTLRPLSSQPSSHYQLVSDSPRPQAGARQFGLQSEPRDTSASLQSQASAAVRSPQLFSSFSKALPVSRPTQTLDQDSHAQSYVPPEVLSVFYQAWPLPNSQTEAKPVDTSIWTQARPSDEPRSSGPVLFTPGHEDERGEVKVFQHPHKIRSTNPTSTFASVTTNLPYSAVSALRSSSSASTFPFSSLGHGSFNTTRSFLHSTVGNQPQTAAAILALPSPLPISIPPYFPSAEPSSTSPPLTSVTVPSSIFSKLPSSTALFSHFSSSVSSPSSFSSSRPVKGSALSPSTVSPVITSSSVASWSSSVSSYTFPPSLSSFTSPSSSMFFYSTTPHPGPSPVPRRSLNNPVSSASPVPLQRVTVGQWLLIHDHVVSSKPELNLNPPTPTTMVYPNPLLHPDPSDLKPNTDGKPKHPSVPSKTPDKEGKYPDIVPRHSTWELGMLLGCSAGLGMVLVVGVRYMYRQACGKKTEMTLNDREREYGRGERGLIHVQECGDLVRVRRIRENSFVLLAEYDILTSPGD